MSLTPGVFQDELVDSGQGEARVSEASLTVDVDSAMSSVTLGRFHAGTSSDQLDGCFLHGVADGLGNPEAIGCGFFHRSPGMLPSKSGVFQAITEDSGQCGHKCHPSHYPITIAQKALDARGLIKQEGKNVQESR